MRSMFVASIVLVLSVHVCPTRAGLMMTLDPSSRTVNLGDTADVTIGISGLDDVSPRALAFFTIGLAFDPAILSVRSVAFGDQVAGADYLAPSSTVHGLSAVDTLALSETALAPASLVDNQPDAFGLVTVTFDAIGLGTSPLYALSLLADEQGYGLLPDSMTVSGSVTVQAVPVPGAVVLGLVGLGLAARLRRDGTR